MSLYKAFAAGAAHRYEELYETAALRTMLPWMIAEIEDVRRDMGDDWWPYGFEPNRACARYVPALSPRAGAVEAPARAKDLFAPETLEAFKI